MNSLYILQSLLFALSLILINPWGSDRAAIWTEPKLLMVNLITALNIVIILCCRHQSFPLQVPKWKVGIWLWIVFLGVGLIATLHSPFPLRSLWGVSSLRDGLAYWVMLAGFVLSNAWAIQIRPQLFQLQLYGILVGGAITALSIFPQILDWRIDYTNTLGQVSPINPQMLKSTIWQSHMPIGLYSNRGHSAYALAIVGVFTVLSTLFRYIKVIPAITIYTVITVALLLTQTRAGIVALLIGTVELLLRFHTNKLDKPQLPQYFWICLVVNCSLLFSYIASKISGFFVSILATAFISYSTIETFSTGRLHLWQLALKGIFKRPFFGWGFDGFGIAFPFLADWKEVHRGYLPPEKVAIERITDINDFTFNYLGCDGYIHTGLLITNKAHNLFLDTLISTGILGLISYILLITYFSKYASNSTLCGVEAVVIVFGIYTSTWYESAQFSHLIWWILSVGFGFPQYFNHKV